VKGYRHFYSVRRSLRYLVRLRFGRLLEHLWGRLYIHRWQKEPANRDYVQALVSRGTPGGTGPRGTP
jgi:hypothetical protein